jgi:hypothetical protein
VRASVAADYSGARTLAVVYEPHATGTVFATVVSHAGAGYAGITLREDNSGSWVCSTVGYGDPRVGATPVKAPQVVIAVLGPAVATYERDGVDVKTSGSTGAGASITGTLVVGAQSIVGVRACKSVALVACWSRALSSDDKAELLAYCAARWTT